MAALFMSLLGALRPVFRTRAEAAGGSGTGGNAGAARSGSGGKAGSSGGGLDGQAGAAGGGGTSSGGATGMAGTSGLGGAVSDGGLGGSGGPDVRLDETGTVIVRPDSGIQVPPKDSLYMAVNRALILDITVANLNRPKPEGPIGLQAHAATRRSTTRTSGSRSIPPKIGSSRSSRNLVQARSSS